MPDTGHAPTPRVSFASLPLRDGPVANAAVERAASDDHEFLRDVTVTALDWAGDFQVRAGGAANAFTLDVGAVSALSLRDAAGTHYHAKAYGGGTVGPAAVEGGGGTLGALARWWHLYAFLAGDGSVGFELSTTPPNPTRRLKATDPTRRYLAAFPTDAAGAPAPLVASGGRYAYRRSAAGGEAFVVGSAAGASARPAPGAWTAASLAAWVPPWARAARLWAFVRRAASDAAAVYLDLRAPGDPAFVTAAVANYSGAVDTVDAAEVTVVAPAQAIEYALSAAVTAADPYGARLAVAGWEE